MLKETLKVLALRLPGRRIPNLKQDHLSALRNAHAHPGQAFCFPEVANPRKFRKPGRRGAVVCSFVDVIRTSYDDGRLGYQTGRLYEEGVPLLISSDACYDRGSIFRRKWFLNDGTLLNPKSSGIVFFFSCLILALYLGHESFTSGCIFSCFSNHFSGERSLKLQN